MRTVFSNLSKYLILTATVALSGYFGVNQYMAASAASEPLELAEATSNADQLIAKNFKLEPRANNITNDTLKTNNTTPNAASNSNVSTTVVAPVKPAIDASLPTYISIGGYVSANIQVVGLTAGGAIDVPGSAVGWWNGSAKPNTVGAVFLDGHNPGALSGLVGVPIGTNIAVTMGDNSVINYQVVGRQIYDYIWNNPADQRNRQIMAEALSSRGGSKGLNIMTCYGTPVAGTYSQRLVIYSQQI